MKESFVHPQAPSEVAQGVLVVNNGHLESPIAHVSVSVSNTMPASEIVAKALISFDLVVRTSETFFFLIFAKLL